MFCGPREASCAIVAMRGVLEGPVEPYRDAPAGLPAFLVRRGPDDRRSEFLLPEAGFERAFLDGTILTVGIGSLVLMVKLEQA